MGWHIQALADATPLAWKNGGGLTRELVAWPEAQAWVWRMSVAEIARKGPFSQFAGVERWFAVLSGAGVSMDVGSPPSAKTYRLTPDSPPLRFAGDSPADCTLIEGATLAFNLMQRDGADEGCMLRVAGQYASTLNTSKIIAAYTISTGAGVYFDNECINLPAHTLAWRDCPVGSRVQVRAAQALWMEIAS